MSYLVALKMLLEGSEARKRAHVEKRQPGPVGLQLAAVREDRIDILFERDRVPLRPALDRPPGEYGGPGVHVRHSSRVALVIDGHKA